MDLDNFDFETCYDEVSPLLDLVGPADANHRQSLRQRINAKILSYYLSGDDPDPIHTVKTVRNVLIEMYSKERGIGNGGPHYMTNKGSCSWLAE